jgi:hypothetical protein
MAAIGVRRRYCEEVGSFQYIDTNSVAAQLNPSISGVVLRTIARRTIPAVGHSGVAGLIETVGPGSFRLKVPTGTTDSPKEVQDALSRGHHPAV